MAARAQGVMVYCGDVTSLPDYDLRYRGLRMQVTVYDGSPLIHIREKVSSTVTADPQAPSTSTGRRRTSYTRKGVTLTADEWEQLLDMGDEVERVVARSLTGPISGTGEDSALLPFTMRSGT